MPPSKTGTAHPTLAEIADRITIGSTDCVRIGDQDFDVTKTSWKTTDANDYLRSPLRYALQRLLYSRCYVWGTTDPKATDTEQGKSESPVSATATGPPSTSASDQLDHGWRVTNVMPNGAVAAEKRDAIGTFSPGQYLNADGPALPKKGNRIAIHVPRASNTHMPGFRFLFGSTPAEKIPAVDQIRFYFNCRRDHAQELPEQIAAGLNRMQIPFRLKHPSHASQFYRCDNVVVYVRSDHAVPAHCQLSQTEKVAARMLDSAVPLFTRRLANGFAVAESPRDGRSFGTHRCALVADGLVRAYEANVTEPTKRLRCILEAFNAAGIPASDPHLNCQRDLWGINSLPTT